MTPMPTTIFQPMPAAFQTRRRSVSLCWSVDICTRKTEHLGKDDTSPLVADYVLARVFSASMLSAIKYSPPRTVTNCCSMNR